MWGASVLSLAALAALPCANAITLHKRDNPAVFALPISRSERSQALQKRSSKVVSVDLPNESNLYYMVNITVGTPPQNLSLSLDIGSSDIWVNIPDSKYCSAKDDPCSSTGLFNSKDSSTFKQLDYSMNATYAGGFLAAGHYATDTLVIGGAKVKNMEFAVAEESHNPHGILGIGYSIATDAAGHGHQYANLPEALVNSGAIKSAAYSLWLNKIDGTGNLLFGGVNKAQYQGELQTVPVVPLYDRYYSLAIALTEVSVEKSGGTKTIDSGLPISVSLDNGSAFIVLPQELIDPILKEVGAGYSKSDDVAYIDCTKTIPDYNVTFSFSGAKVNVPLSELVLPYAQPDFPKGNCMLGLAYSQPGVNLMGDSFMRSAYIVYDLANNEISLANTKYDGGDDDIHEIGTGTDAVPGATLVPSAVTSATGNGAAATGGASGAQPSTIQVTMAGTVTGTASNVAATSTSKGLAALPTSNPNHLLPGLLGAGLLLAL
ncbi:putative aspartic-type endopeptidase opsB [Penicillium rolfsii]|nr:putative aspartic-type endopeptidase opsB [Penicillium rolfsii]